MNQSYFMNTSVLKSMYDKHFAIPLIYYLYPSNIYTIQYAVYTKASFECKHCAQRGHLLFSIKLNECDQKLYMHLGKLWSYDRPLHLIPTRQKTYKLKIESYVLVTSCNILFFVTTSFI